MTIQGVVHNGVIVPDNELALPDGTRVDIVVHESAKAASELGETLLKYAGKAQHLPENLAAQHDHYLYGTPKR